LHRFILVVPTLLSLHVVQQSDTPRFRVSVDAVRIDAVVTDRDGRIVSDLTADDFEVLQNGKRQRITFAQFIPVRVASPERAEPAPRRADAPVVASAPISRADVQRTIGIVVDDLGLSVESLYYAKRGLRTFLERDVQATDLVGILRTGGSDAVQPFTTDRRILLDTVDALRWNGFSRSGVEPYEAVEQFTTFDERHGMGEITDFKAVSTLHKSMSASGTLGALNLAIRGARDLPGRKAIIFVSEGFPLNDEDGPDTRVRTALDHVIDQATRAGVVIYSLDARGLQSGGLQASDNLKRPTPGETMERTVSDESAKRGAFNRNTQDALAYVAEQTGGFAVLNTNDLGRGMARISADVRDYYVIGYLPEEGTFVGEGKKPSYHKVDVRVRRPGLRVKTRRQFLGVSDAEERDVPKSPAQELIHAAISPFTATDIALSATTLPGYAADKGLFVRTLLHLDARALTFAAAGDAEKQTASADVLGMVFDRNGTEVAHLSTGFSVALTDQATEEALQAGLVYTLNVPIPRAGAYQMRFAVRDHQSGKLGSTGEFVQLPDVKSGAFALSGIVLASVDAPRSSGAPADSGTVAVSPAQALRVYQAGTEISYAYEIYNGAKEVHSATSIWRGTDNIASLPADRLTRPAGGEQRFAAAGRLKLGEGLPPGSYVLQVAARTADSNQRRQRTAIQRIPFEIRQSSVGSR
jgi:VWFA-related protein